MKETRKFIVVTVMVTIITVLSVGVGSLYASDYIGDSIGPVQVGEYEESAMVVGKDKDLAETYARNFTYLLAREADEIPGTPDLEIAELHSRNFVNLLAREADEANAGPDLEIVKLHTRNFASLLAREADKVGVEPDQKIAKLHARNFDYLLSREVEEVPASDLKIVGLQTDKFILFRERDKF